MMAGYLWCSVDCVSDKYLHSFLHIVRAVFDVNLTTQAVLVNIRMRSKDYIVLREKEQEKVTARGKKISGKISA